MLHIAGGIILAVLLLPVVVWLLVLMVQTVLYLLASPFIALQAIADEFKTTPGAVAGWIGVIVLAIWIAFRLAHRPA